MTDTLNTLRIEGNSTKLVKIIYKNLTETVIVNSEILNAFTLKLGIPLNIPSIQYCARLGILVILTIVTREKRISESNHCNKKKSYKN